MNEGGLGRRAGMGVKLCLQRMTDPSGGVNTSKKDVARAANSETEVGVQGPRKGNDIDALVTQEILFAYGISEAVFQEEPINIMRRADVGLWGE